MQELRSILPTGLNQEEVSMNQEHKNLPHRHLSPGTLITDGTSSSGENVSLDEAAISIMTDFSHVRPFSIPPTATIDEINQKMIACGVRLLFVAENNDVLQGLVTYNDIFGEKPVRYLQEHGGQRHEITTQDILTPVDQLEALQLSDISKSSVGDILKTIQNSGRHHLLVVQDQAHGEAQVITGLFSSTQMEKQLGIKIEVSPRANTFSDLERALNE